MSTRKPPTRKGIASKPLYVRVPAFLHELVSDEAAREARTLSQQVAEILRAHYRGVTSDNA
jgi:predicted HicB family RNase H-like nuclease